MLTKNICASLFFLLSLWQCHSVCGQVVINEITIHSNTADALVREAPCEGGREADEWIELFNASPCQTVDLSCWILGANMGPDPELCEGLAGANAGFFVFPQGTTLDPLEVLSIGGTPSPQSGLAFDINIGDFADGNNHCFSPRFHLDSQRGWIGLFRLDGTVSDAVYWGESGQNEIETEAQFLSSGLVGCACGGETAVPSALNLFFNEQIEYVGATNFDPDRPNNPGQVSSFARQPDGGCWQAVAATSPGECNQGDCPEPPQEFPGVLDPAQDFYCAGDAAVRLLGESAPVLSQCRNEITYQWRSSQGQILSNAANGATDLQESGTIIYEVIYNGCVYQSEIEVNVLPLPDLSRINITETLTPCLGEPIFLEFLGELPEEVDVFWELDGGDVLSGNQNSAGPVEVAWFDPGQKNLRLSLDAGDCVSESPFIQLNVGPGPEIRIESIESITCQNTDSIRLEAIADPGVTAITWEFDGGFAEPDSGKGPLRVMWQDSGQKRVVAIAESDDFECPGRSRPLEVIVRPQPLSFFGMFEPQEGSCRLPWVEYVYPNDASEFELVWDFDNALNKGPNAGQGRHFVRWERAGLKFLELLVYQDGCPSDTTRRVMDYRHSHAFMLNYRPPTAFSPNNDGLNDEYSLVSMREECMRTFKFQVFDRWGAPVFTIPDDGDVWRGEDAPPGVYSYRLEYETWDGLSDVQGGTITVVH